MDKQQEQPEVGKVLLRGNPDTAWGDPDTAVGVGSGNASWKRCLELAEPGKEAGDWREMREKEGEGVRTGRPGLALRTQDAG